MLKECQCHSDGTINKDSCNEKTGKCLCKPNRTGLYCDTAGRSLTSLQKLSIQISNSISQKKELTLL